MNDINDLKSFRLFLENKIFNEPLIKIQRINRGGCSVNYKVSTSTSDYLVKLLPQKNLRQTIRLQQILQLLKTQPQFYSAHLFEKDEIFSFENFNLLVLQFLKGKKLKYFQLSPSFIPAIAENYRQLLKIPFTATNLPRPQDTPQAVYLKNNTIIQNIADNSSRHVACMKKFFETYNEKIYRNIPSIKKKPAVIHGDASLNNMLFTDKGDVAFLDLELIRYGYPVEDAAELIFASLLPHYIFMSPVKALQKLIVAFNNIADFSADEWRYGIGMHFLHYITRRLRGGKLFRSYRKDWLVKRYLQKFDILMTLIDKLY